MVDDVRNELELGADVSDVFDSLERYPGTLGFHKTPFFTLSPYFKGASALFFALLNSRRNAVELLIDSGSGLQDINLNGATSLHLASGGMGIAAGALISSQLSSRLANNLKRINRYSRAASLDEIRRRARILEHRELTCPATFRRSSLYLSTVDQMLMARDVFGATALHRAAAANTRLEVIRLLVDRGSSIDAADQKKMTSLHKALSFNPNLSISQFLIGQGADISRVSDVGTTLHHAAINWNPEVLKLLLKRGTDIDVKNRKGQDLIAFCGTQFYA